MMHARTRGPRSVGTPHGSHHPRRSGRAGPPRGLPSPARTRRRDLCALLAAAAGLLLASGAPLAGQSFDLTVANIMRGPEHVGAAPEGVTWTDDGEWIYFRWKPGGEAWHEDRSLYRVRAEGGEPERLTDERADSLAPLLAGGDVSRDERWRVTSSEGDLFLIDRRTLEIHRLTDTEARETDPTFGGSGRTVYYVRDANLFALDRETGVLRQLTDIRRGPPDDEEDPEGHRAFLAEQQEELFEHVRREVERREEEEAREEALDTDPEPIHIGQDERVLGIMVEPDERWAFLQVGRQPEDARSTIVPDYVTESGFTVPLEVRAKVGDAQSTARLALVELETGATRWLDLVPDAEESGAEADPDSAAGGQETPELAALRFVGWNEAGSHGLVVATAYDFRDLWIYAVAAETGELTLLARDHDDAWLGGACGTIPFDLCVDWMPDGDAVWFVSERSGYAHLYTVGLEGGEPRALTRGTWEVTGARIDADQEHFLLTTGERSPYERHLYRMGLDGGERVRISTRPGRHDATPSPAGERLAVVHSSADHPPELYVTDAEPGAPMTRVTESPTEDWLAGRWVRPEIVEITARDGTAVPARIYRPRDVGAAAHGGAVIFVHGAGYLQNVHRWWSSYFREYMFHHLLASRGYTVLDIDYRGSAGHGRDWRTAIYRHMGGKDLTDQVDGARYLVEHEGVDAGRIGIYGGSYGGFITLMALFTEAETFAAGAALRAVTDWAHYNHWYTSRILNLPHEDEEAYRRSSPIYFAEGLADPLLIAHGMVDTNVHFQDVVRLAQRLIELGKENWEMAVYPVEGHGFREPASWTDEYRRILELMERHVGAAADDGR